MDGDFYLKLATLNALRRGEHSLGLRLGFVGYAHEKENDFFSWRLSDRVPLSGGDWELYGAFGGQVYTQGDPGTTDASFDNLSFDLAGERSVRWGAKTDFVFGPGYQLTYFTSFDHRSDQNRERQPSRRDHDLDAIHA